MDGAFEYDKALIVSITVLMLSGSCGQTPLFTITVFFDLVRHLWKSLGLSEAHSMMYPLSTFGDEIFPLNASY